MLRSSLVACGLGMGLFFLSWIATPAQTGDSSDAQPASAADAGQGEGILARGQYLADAANCYSCHTRAGGVPFSGGVAFETPFGRIYSTNITPDGTTGIGSWKEDDLRRAMHEGIAADGSHLFPAFPYPSYTKVEDADVAAIYAYLRSLQPASYTPPKNGLLFSQRWALAIWNALFFKSGRFVPDTSQSTEWNRGAYLTAGLGHCGACHTPRNVFMAELSDKAYEGGVVMDRVAENKVRRWSAVNLTSAKHGLGSWSVDALAKYLHTGFSPRGGAFGPMNEVIVNSLVKLTAEDAKAMAVYLKSLPGREYMGQSVSAEQAEAGAALYEKRCEECHTASGRGGIFSAPPLAGSAIVQAEDPSSLLNVILHGPATAEAVSYGGWETMKSFGDVLEDAEVAAVSNYVRGSWGNVGRAVTADEVARQR